MLTPKEIEVLMHRLESTTVQEVLCEDDEDMDEDVVEAQVNLMMMQLTRFKALPVAMDDIDVLILTDCVDGSTYFSNEEDHDEELASKLEIKMSAHLGKRVRFPRC